MFTRLFRPFLAFDGDETTGGAEPVEAPTADQPDVTTSETAPDTGTSEPEAQTTEPETPETPEAPADDGEQFTDLSAVPPELQDRAKEMQADYTRKTQALAERHAELDHAVSFVTDLVADEPNETMEAVFKTLAAKLGYDLEGDDDATPDDDTDAEPEDTRTDREKWIDDQREREQSQAEADAQAAHEAHLDEIETGITDGITALAKADGIDLTPDELDVIFDSVLALPPTAENGPATQAAWNRFKAASKASADRYFKSKGSTLAPGGPAAGDAVDLSTPEARIAHSARRIEAARRA